VQWGPTAPWREPSREVVQLRRYVCLRCDSVLVVGPRGLARHKRYSTPAIALALALWALAGVPEPEVFERVSVYPLSVSVLVQGWRSLRRWTADVVAGALWPRLCTHAPGSTYRQHAERIAASLAGFAPDPEVGSHAARAFHGAKHARGG
jgi:hypothetical protein